MEKECFPETEWTGELLFNAFTDKVNYQIMDVTKYVGNSQFKKTRNGENFRVYFDPKDYSIEEELAIMKKIKNNEKRPLLTAGGEG